MATVTTTRPLTIEEFERRYAASDRALEFWHGEVVEKAVPTWLHSVLQIGMMSPLRFVIN